MTVSLNSIDELRVQRSPTQHYPIEKQRGSSFFQKFKPSMPSVRVDITADVVKRADAMARAAKDSTAIADWFDIRQHYLQLRQRGRQVTWFVRARGRSQKIGVANSIRGEFDRGLLSIKQARDRAAEVYAGIEAVEPVGREPAWTWSDLDRKYQTALKETRWRAGRVKPPSRGTQDDVRLAFAKPPIAALAPKQLTALTSLDLTRAVDQVHADNGHRAACKTLAYVKSALTWALSKRGERSGLHGTMPWWTAMRPPDPTGGEILEMLARRKTLAAAKVAFGVDHLGALLVEHEAFCAGRRAEEKISPGVRWGLWWVSFTGNRRFSTVALERERLLQADEFGRPGWGRCAWPPETMKGRHEFWLPLPPAVLAIANGSIADWTQLVRNEHGDLTSKWVFASTRRTGRDPENDDVAVYPNSLNAHLRALRGTKGISTVDRLKDLPWFSLHLVRSVAGNFLDNAPGVPKAGISAMLAHADEETDDRLAPTTRAFYVQNQMMPQKSDAMAAWSEALIAAYQRAGGKMPQPIEGPRPSKLRPRAA
jgi:hypothetical protein